MDVNLHIEGCVLICFSRSFLDLHDAMFYLVCLVPLCIAVLQILTWTPFSIQNSHVAALH